MHRASSAILSRSWSLNPVSVQVLDVDGDLGLQGVDGTAIALAGRWSATPDGYRAFCATARPGVLIQPPLTKIQSSGV